MGHENGLMVCNEIGLVLLRIDTRLFVAGFEQRNGAVNGYPQSGDSVRT